MLRNTALAVVALATAAFAQNYCVPQSTIYACGSDEYISNVTVANLNNNSVCIPVPGYEDFTNTVGAVQLAGGQTYPISVTIGTSWASDVVYVMLDANGDGTFNTTPAGGELLATLGPLTMTGGTQIVTGQITIPPVVAGNTRLRVRLSYGTMASGTEACANNNFGNCEDYSVSTGGGPVTPEYQVNQPSASHDIDGVQGTAFSTANVNKCAGDGFVVNLNSSNVGFPFDVLVSPIPVVPVSQGGLWTGNQAVNVNLAAFVFGFGGFTTPFFGNLALPFSFGAAADFYTQMAVVDPSNPDGIAISQPNGLHILQGASLAGFTPPTGDDAYAVIPSPACLPFYGQSRSNGWITTNGRIGFGTMPSAAYFATSAAALTGDPFVGYWGDLHTYTTGTISVTQPVPGLTRADWLGVAYYGQAGLVNTFGVQLDALTNTVTIDGLNTIVANTSTMMLGLSAGNTGSSDPGSISFSNAGVGTTGVGTPGPNPGMIYNLGTAGAASAGLTSIIFVWNSITGNYDWASF